MKLYSKDLKFLSTFKIFVFMGFGPFQITQADTGYTATAMAEVANQLISSNDTKLGDRLSYKFENESRLNWPRLF